jgi:hypothetical protein
MHNEEDGDALLKKWVLPILSAESHVYVY